MQLLQYDIRNSLDKDDYILPEHEDVISELPSFYESHMTFYRARNIETPLLPQTRSEIQLEGTVDTDFSQRTIPTRRRRTRSENTHLFNDSGPYQPCECRDCIRRRNFLHLPNHFA